MNKITKYIKEQKNKVLGIVKGFVFTRGLKTKLVALAWLLVNIFITGIIITFILELWNSTYRFISFGLLSAIIMFYLKWLRKLIVTKSVAEIDKL